MKDPRVPGCDAEKATLTSELTAYAAAKRVFNGAVATASVIVSDPMTVDARVEVAGSEIVAQIPQLKGSPGATAMAKGFQAVVRHDWPLALAWWQTAQLRDPDNPAIAAGVDLAKWTVDYYRNGGKQPTIGAIKAASQVPMPPGWYRNLAKTMDDQLVAEAIAALEKSVADAEDWLRKHPK